MREFERALNYGRWYISWLAMRLRQLVVERIDDMNYPTAEKKRNKEETKKRILQQTDNQPTFFFYAKL